MLHAVGAATLDDAGRRRRCRAAIRTHAAARSAAADRRGGGDRRTARAGGAERASTKSLIGMGYHGTHTPPVILRNVLENPGWYTAYTPYQAEIAQGRLEALLNFQTMICELTGMEIANASLLDEATAAAEAMAHGARRQQDASPTCLRRRPTCIRRPAPCWRRARGRSASGWSMSRRAIWPRSARRSRSRWCCNIPAPPARCATCRRRSAPRMKPARWSIVGADPLALALLTPPGEMGADVVVGSAQRFGVPMGFGGPHAGFFATTRRLQAAHAGPAGRRVASTPPASRRCAWRCRRASSTSGARRRPPTSAPRRCCWR